MPRGFRFGEYEKQVTKLLRTNGIFRDRRTKIVHDIAGAVHLHLFGEDMSEQRRRFFIKKHAPEHFHLDHKKGGTSGRCDCQHNLQPLSPEAHEKKHGRTTRFAEVHNAG